MYTIGITLPTSLVAMDCSAYRFVEENSLFFHLLIQEDNVASDTTPGIVQQPLYDQNWQRVPRHNHDYSQALCGTVELRVDQERWKHRHRRIGANTTVHKRSKPCNLIDRVHRKFTILLIISSMCENKEDGSFYQWQHCDDDGPKKTPRPR